MINALMKHFPALFLAVAMVSLSNLSANAEGADPVSSLKPGNAVKVSLRGVNADEQNKVSGEYRVSDGGLVRLPMLDGPLKASGLTADQLARVAEKAYRDEGIYDKPAIEVEVITAPVIATNGSAAEVTFGGQVLRPGTVPYTKGMTLLQGLQKAGDRNIYGGRNIRLHRNGKVRLLDFRKAEDKNLLLEPGDAITVDQAGAFEFDRG
jgi:protein involved in polysaccharide export with SLBB domain